MLPALTFPTRRAKYSSCIWQQKLYSLYFEQLFKHSKITRSLSSWNHRPIVPQSLFVHHPSKYNTVLWSVVVRSSSSSVVVVEKEDLYKKLHPRTMNKTLHLPTLFQFLSESSLTDKEKFKSLRTALYNTTQYDPEKAWLIYQQMIQLGVDRLLKPNHYGQLLNIMKYAGSESVPRMLGVLDRMKHPSSYHISQVLYAMSRQGRAQEALDLIRAMRDRNHFQPQTNHYLSLAIALKKSGTKDPVLINESLQLMIDGAESRDIEINSSIQSTVISILSHSGHNDLITRFMKAANDSYRRNRCKHGDQNHEQHYNVHIYTSLILKFGNEGDIQTVRRLFKEMRKHSIKPTLVTYTTLMHAYSKAGDFKASIRLLEDYQRRYKRIESSMVTAILTQAIRHDMDTAHKTVAFMNKHNMCLEQMDDRLRTTLLWMKTKDRMEEAREFFDYLYSLKKEYINHIMIDHLVTGYGSQKDKDKVIDCFNLRHQLTRPLSAQEELRSRHHLVDALFRCGDVSAALGVYAYMRHQDSVPDDITTAMVVKGLLANNEPDLAWSLFKSLQAEGLQPNLHAYSSILKALGHKQDMLRKKDHPTHIDPQILQSAGIRLSLDFLHSPVPSTTEALNLFRQMTGFHQPNAYTYTTLIACFSKFNIEEAISIFRHMCAHKISPTVETYTALLQGCAIFRNSELGLLIFNHMTERHIQPNTATWRYLLKCLLRSRVDKKEIDRIGAMAMKAMNKESK